MRFFRHFLFNIFFSSFSLARFLIQHFNFRHLFEISTFNIFSFELFQSILNDHNLDERNESDFDDDDDEEEEKEEEEIDNDFANTAKENFNGMRIYSVIDSKDKHKYFKVTINGKEKYIHKQTAVWYLTNNNSQLSQFCGLPPWE